MTGSSVINRPGRVWQITTCVLLVVSIGLLLALIIVASEKESTRTRTVRITGDVPVCGHGSNPNGNKIDLSEPATPGPFHDLTKEEIRKLRTFLQQDSRIQALPTETVSRRGINSSYIFMADLWVAPKADVLDFLDNNGPQPDRQARVMMFRGDKTPPVVEEWICRPLPDVTSCNLLNFTNRRNPVEFESRPFNTMEFAWIMVLLDVLQPLIGHITMESFGAPLSGCADPMDCLVMNPSPTASGLSGNLGERRIWLWALYNVPYRLLHPVDFGIQAQLDGSDPDQWTINYVWYAGQVFSGIDDLVQQYETGNITKVRTTKPVFSENLFSTLHRRGAFSPPTAQRPPMQVEPDGKRYSVMGRKVDYLGWSFNFRLSTFQGPQLYDIRFKGERIAYQLGLSEIAAFYSGYSPLSQATDYVDSGAMSALGTKALVPGGDCPDSATLINYSVMNQHSDEPGQYDSVFCLFEHNNGYPLRRHLEYTQPTGYYGGMLDSVLNLRSALTVGNYDYIIDFIFHQNGALETRLMSTGAIQSNVFREVERLYGFKLEETIVGNLHHHLFHLKADLDVGGTSNRYETLDIERMNTVLSWNSSLSYGQTQFSKSLKRRERDALYHYDFENPKDHIVFNDANTNKWGEKRAYRIHLSGMSKNLLPEGLYNEKVISWARNQIAVTRQKDEEFASSSNYGMWDTLDPVVDFSRFYEDNERIVDKDLVFWLTMGLHHIPHTEDLPVTPTAGNHLTAFLLPYNYFPECPSMGSRDAIFVSYKDGADPSKGVKVERNGNSRDQCITPRANLEELVNTNPDLVLETKRVAPTI